MDVNKNSYTIIFSVIMATVVALLLSVLYMCVKPKQDKNIEQEKKQNILKSIGKDVDRPTAENIYSKFIIKELVLKTNGDIVNEYRTSFLDSISKGLNSDLSEIQIDKINKERAFSIDIAKELKKDGKDQLLPLYIAKLEGQKKYIIPLRGKGLWGPVWGFIALESDANTISAAVFDHKSETPGLGAEINKPIFQDQFPNKHIYDLEKQKVMFEVVKKGNKKGKYEVDGIGGGTITSVGVSNMINERFKKYFDYLVKDKDSYDKNESKTEEEIKENNDLNDNSSNIGNKDQDYEDSKIYND